MSIIAYLKQQASERKQTVMESINEIKVKLIFHN
jgi:hypothetical protein